MFACIYIDRRVYLTCKKGSMVEHPKSCQHKHRSVSVYVFLLRITYYICTCLDEFMLLMILRLGNAESLTLYDVVILKLCCVMLCDALTTLVCYRSPQINRSDLKGDLNSCFRRKLPVYDLEMI